MGNKNIKPKLNQIPPERTLELCKMVLDHLGSRLREDVVVSPNLNEVAILAVEIKKELKNEK